MVREVASGRGRQGRQHRGGTAAPAGVAAATRATVELTTASTAKKAAAKRVMVSPITPATKGRRGGEYVSTRTHPLTPNPAYTPNPTLPLGPRGDQHDPRTGLLSRHMDEAAHPACGQSGDGQKTWFKGIERDENAASRWAVACEHAGSRGQKLRQKG